MNEEARRELLVRLGEARAQLDQASGWLRELDCDEMRAAGFDLRFSTSQQLEEVVALLDRMIGALKGDELAAFKLLYDQNRALIQGARTLAKKLFGL